MVPAVGATVASPTTVGGPTRQAVRAESRPTGFGGRMRRAGTPRDPRGDVTVRLLDRLGRDLETAVVHPDRELRPAADAQVNRGARIACGSGIEHLGQQRGEAGEHQSSLVGSDDPRLAQSACEIPAVDHHFAQHDARGSRQLEVALDTSKHPIRGPASRGFQEIVNRRSDELATSARSWATIKTRNFIGVQYGHPLARRQALGSRRIPVPHVLGRDLAARQAGERSGLRGDVRDGITDRPVETRHPP